MLKELFRATAQHDVVTQTILIAASEDGIMYPIQKEIINYRNHTEYHFTVYEWFARSEEDVDIMTALQYFCGESVNVPEDFEFDHP